MNIMDNDAIFEKLISNILDTHYENVNKKYVESAKDRIIDVVGCIIGGANAVGNAELIKMIMDWGGKEEATILVHGGKAPAVNAVMANIVMARSYDFVPCSPVVDGMVAGGYVCVGTIPTAITVGESKAISGKELITSVLVGDDLHSRISAANFDRNEMRKAGAPMKWDSTAAMNGFGTAAIAGRILGLNKQQMRNALGIVLHQLGGSFLQAVYDGAMSFKLAQAIPARDGIFSAQLAKAGWTGPKNALFSPNGYYRLYGEGEQFFRFEQLTKDLGEIFYTDNHIKPYPCCRSTHVPVACALAVANNHDFDAQDIQEAILYLSPAGMKHACARPFKIGEFPQANAIWSYQYTIATALLRKSVRPEHFSEQSIRDPQINTLVSKITMSEKPEADMLNAELKVIMKDGREIIESADVPKGDQSNNPMSRDEIIAKYWLNVDFSNTLSRDNAGKLLKILVNLEELQDVNEMIRLMVP